MIKPDAACGIYAIVNNAIGRVYIGQTMTTFAHRWQTHRYQFSARTHNNIELMDDWRDCGAGAFDFAILRAFQPRLKRNGLRIPMNDLETYFIYTSDCWLYNQVVPRYYYRPEPQLWKFLDPYRLEAQP